MNDLLIDRLETQHLLTPIASSKDPADDGMEINIIRVTTQRPETFYRNEIKRTLYNHTMEEVMIYEVEYEFCKKVGAL